MLFSSHRVADILNVSNVSVDAEKLSSVAIDSRNCTENSLFVALVGEKADGIDYMEQALQNGARLVIAKKRNSTEEGSKFIAMAEKYNSALFYVNNPLYALQSLARYHITRFPNLIKIAITGSSGKTTTKEMIVSILKQDGEVAYTKGNLNSDSGLPLSCFQINTSHKYAVLEMGMNRTGEIEELASIFKPKYALITNVGSAHIGFLGSMQAIANEKKAIFSQFTGTEVAFVPQQDSYASCLAENVKGKTIFYAPSLLKRLNKIENLGLDGYKLTLSNEVIHLNTVGKHSLHDACLAIFLAQELSIKTDLIKKGLESFKVLGNRNKIIKGKITVISDCYNANAQSMKSALDFVKELSGNHKILFLSAMRELGVESEEIHRNLASSVIESGALVVYLLGEDMVYLSSALKNLHYNGQIYYNTQFNVLAERFIKNCKEGDLLLLKGSRFYELERLLTMLAGHNFINIESLKEETQH